MLPGYWLFAFIYARCCWIQPVVVVALPIVIYTTHVLVAVIVRCCYGYIYVANLPTFTTGDLLIAVYCLPHVYFQQPHCYGSRLLRVVVLIY